jgi:molybdopterin converting factor small subunit
MQISVKCYATLKKYAPTEEGSFTLELAPGASMKDLFDSLGMPPELEKVMLVNGMRAYEETLLSSGDEVALFPPVEGG